MGFGPLPQHVDYMVEMLAAIGFILPSLILQIFRLPLAFQQIHKGLPFRKRRQMDKPILARQDAEKIVPMAITSPPGYMLLMEIANHDVLQSRRHSLL